MLRVCMACRRLASGTSESLRFCACGRSYSGRRCRSCLALSDPSAQACQSCGKTDDLSEACASLDLTPVSQAISVVLTAVGLRAALTHPAFVANTALRAVAWLLGTTPDALVRPAAAALRIGLVLAASSFLLPAEPGRRFRSGVLWCARNAFILCVAAARLCFQLFRSAMTRGDGSAGRRGKDSR